jgi:hypothetical protein
VFIVNDAEATAIRQAYERGGEWVALAELRRHFPGVKDNAEAVQWVRTIASWRPSSADAPQPDAPEPS